MIRTTLRVPAIQFKTGYLINCAGEHPAFVWCYREAWRPFIGTLSGLKILVPEVRFERTLFSS